MPPLLFLGRSPGEGLGAAGKAEPYRSGQRLSRKRVDMSNSRQSEQSDFIERDEAIERIAVQLGVRAERGRRFAELTSLRVGGAVDWVISPETEEQAAGVVNELDQVGIAWRPLGSGSNVLADDGDHHYVILSVKDLKGEPAFDGHLVSVSAGYSLPRLCIDAAREEFQGPSAALCG